MRTIPPSIAFVLLAAALPFSACSKSIDVESNNGAGGSTNLPPPELPDCSDAGAAPGTAGPAMIAVGRTDGTCFWIDQTEVTVAQYAAFVASGASPSALEGCAWNDDLTPSCAPLDDPDAGEPDPACEAADTAPVTCVDWCDALAFCTWAGKTLCEGEHDLPDDPDTSSWYAACSHGGENDYPYGDSYDGSACIGSDAPSASEGCPQPVGGRTTCATPAGVQDLSGNVAEWVHACKNLGQDNATCRYRGGSYASASGQLLCSEARSVEIVPRMDNGRLVGRSPSIGFRCCAYSE